MWKIARAVARGTSHVQSGVPCQDECFADSFRINGEDYLIAIVADGAGSASYGEQGAEIACESLFKVVEKTLAHKHISTITSKEVESFVLEVNKTISEKAKHNSAQPRDYACTLLCGVISHSNSFFFQVGDGAIVVSRNNIFGIIFEPDIGQYANMTNFVTQDDVLDHLFVELFSYGDFSCFSMFTDGIQNLALNINNMTPHVPFFEPMLKTLKDHGTNNEIDFNSKLVAFLSSENVNMRTDDDKTLILAVKTS